MSRHQAIRNLDYQNELDEYDEGYSDEEELSPQDQALMRKGTADVLEALGAGASKVTTAQIQEALWHYYYDIDKTVTFLVSKYVAPPEPKKPKATPQKTNGVEPIYMLSRPSQTRESFAHLFRDMPWGNIPKHRETVFIPPPKIRGGLLGGSGAPPKLSKLQQLAAARKKKVEDKKSDETADAVSTRANDLELSKSVSKPAQAQPGAPTLRALPKKLASTNAASPPTASPPAAISSSVSHGLEPMQIDGVMDEAPASSQEPSPGMQDEPVEVETAKPSLFARTLFETTSSAPAAAQGGSFNVPFSTHPAVLAAFSGPSPDDVVLTAQAKAGKKSGPASAKKAAEPNAEDLRALKIDDTPLPKSKHLDVNSEFEKSKAKKSASFVVVGHVDAGKSTMMGRLLLDLQVVDQRTVDKLRQEADKIGKSSFALAWVLDQRSEERARGVTIDIATNRFETDTTVFTILDAPGHQDFIPNMIAGASQADFAILVVDASTGAFEAGLKGQTKEHSLLLRSMGVSRLIVAVNKLDTIGWSKERYDEITQQVSGFLSATGFQATKIAFVPVSGLNGDNLVRRSSDPAASWYTGLTLLEELEASEPSARDLEKPLRLSISEVFRTQQSSVSVSGRIESGSLQMGDALLVQPSGEKAYVKSLLVDDEPQDWAVAGHNVVLHLSNIDVIHVRVGDIICDPTKPIQCLDTFTLKALAFDFLMPMQLDVHRGRFHSAGRVEEIGALLDKVTGSVVKRKPKVAKPGTVARIVVKLSTKVPLEAGQRVHLRSGGKTVAAGLLE